MPTFHLGFASHPEAKRRLERPERSPEDLAARFLGSAGSAKVRVLVLSERKILKASASPRTRMARGLANLYSCAARKRLAVEGG
jgi:hypothetical protein